MSTELDEKTLNKLLASVDKCIAEMNACIKKHPTNVVWVQGCMAKALACVAGIAARLGETEP